MSSTKSNSNGMEWTREKTLLLINEYRARRGLWDMTHDDYRKKDMKQKLLVEVSDSLGGNIPISEIEKKFHTLRTQYHREINRMKRKEPYNSKWFGFKNLQFLSSPKACRTNKARIHSEITEDGTVTTKMESVHDSSGGSPSSEEFLTLNKGTITFETEVATATSTPSNSRSQYEKLIEETTKEDDENMEMKPKVTYKEITIPIDGQSSYIQVNQDLSGSSQHDDHQNQNSSNECILPIPVHEDADGTMYTNGDDSDQTDEADVHQQAPQAIHHAPRIIKIQKRDAYHGDYYDNQQHTAVPTKRIYFDNGKTTIVTATQQQPVKANAPSGNNNAPTVGVIQQRNGNNTVNIKGRLQQIKSTMPAMQPGQSGQKPPAPRDAYATYGEYVANEMRSITNREILISLKHKINTALYDAHMAELQN